MAELNDRNTDALFQAGAERHEFEYNPEAWAMMEAQLDATPPPPATRRQPLGWITGGTLALLALITFLWLTITPTASISDVTPVYGETVTALSKPTPGASKQGRNNLDPGSANTATDRQGNAATTPDQAGATADESGNSPGQSAGGAEATIAKQPGSKSHAIGDNSIRKEHLPTEESMDSKRWLGNTPTEPTTSYSAAIEAGDEPGRSADPDVVRAVAQLVDGQDFFPPVLSTRTNDRKLPLPSVESATANFGSSQGSGGWRGAVGAGIVTGRSGSVALPKAQPRLGLEVERRVGSNVGIAAGTYLNLVHYRIQGDLYEAKPDFFPQGIQPAEVKAACPMIEIPISVKYYFSGSRANSFYASAGAVSYFILKEDYKYKYTEQSAALKKEWTERSGDRHLFGVGLASFGYQRHLPRSGFLALETYVHLPFTAMGHGNVMLRSAGLSLKYQFDFSSRR